MLSDGYVALEPGRLAALVTFLVHDLAALPPRQAFPGRIALTRMTAGDFARYRRLFRAVGADWLWFSRLTMPEAELRETLDDPRVHALRLAGPEGDLGLLELDFRDPDTPELAYFGLVAGAIGQGLGRTLMAEALHCAHTVGAARLHVHTCSLDHPGALRFYCRNGFRPVQRAIEVFPDPRLDGTLPRSAAAFMPVIAPD